MLQDDGYLIFSSVAMTTDVSELRKQTQGDVKKNFRKMCIITEN